MNNHLGSNIFIHQPVMALSIIEKFKNVFQQDQEHLFIDATFGRGGHTKVLLDSFPKSKVVAFDCDPEAIDFGQKNVCPLYEDRLSLYQSKFDLMDHSSFGLAQKSVSAVLFDLGVSSPQLDDASRGFSFMREGPLDMRMSQSGKSAKDVLNTYKEEEIANILFHFGQERCSRRIAKAIVLERQKKKFETTMDLSKLIEKIMPRTRIHQATRTFQALRIYVNQELDQLNTGLAKAVSLLKPGGLLMVISFHSLEDRIVKNFLRNALRDQKLFSEISKKISKPSEEEIQENQRARSACVRWGIISHQKED